VHSEVGKEVVADDGKERVMGLGILAVGKEKRKKKACGLPRGTFWALVAAVIIGVALAVGLGAGISIRNRNETHTAYVQYHFYQDDAFL
jgi:multisubunit Na+/H+ antiporter MnhB subunit